jgi:hypothetical protein
MFLLKEIFGPANFWKGKAIDNASFREFLTMYVDHQFYLKCLLQLRDKRWNIPLVIYQSQKK